MSIHDSPTIGPDEVRRIARLARLDLDEREVERLARELASILGYVKRLEALDVEGLPPLAGDPDPRSLRTDRVLPSLPADEALGAAAEHGDGHFKVPRVID